MQSEQHVTYRLFAGEGREVQANMEETDGELAMSGGSSLQLTYKKGAHRCR